MPRYPGQASFLHHVREGEKGRERERERREGERERERERREGEREREGERDMQ